MNKETHGFPAFMSFILPGLGQIIKGQVGKGIAIMIAEIILGVSLLIELSLLGESYGYALKGAQVITAILFLIWFPLWIWNIYDAYNKPIKK